MDADLVYGIDVSPFQRKVDWVRSYAAGTRFVWHKASEGEGWESPTLREQVEGSHAAGLLVGAYHYAREAISDPVVAARHHVNLTASLPLKLRHMLDIEWDRDEAKMTGKQIVAWALAWLREVQSLTGHDACIYASPGYIDGVLGSESLALGSYPLVVAAYPWEKPDWLAVRSQAAFNVERTRIAREELSKRRRNMQPFAWQWTGDGRVDGVDGPVDRIVTTVGQLRALTIPEPMTRAEWAPAQDARQFLSTLTGPDSVA